jgi:head-tail adaptor
VSLIGSRVGLRYLCAIARDANAGASDAWGGSPTPNWQPLATVPCNAWTGGGRELVEADRTAVVEDRRVSVPLGTDVTEADRVASVTARFGGAVVFEGPMNVEAVLRYDDHLELVLGRVR